MTLESDDRPNESIAERANEPEEQRKRKKIEGRERERGKGVTQSLIRGLTRSGGHLGQKRGNMVRRRCAWYMGVGAEKNI